MRRVPFLFTLSQKRVCDDGDVFANIYFSEREFVILFFLVTF